MNTLPNIYKLIHFNLTMSPLYLVKLKITHTKQPTAYAVHSVEPIVPDFRRKSFDVRFLLFLLENFFSSLQQKIFYILTGFIKLFYSNSIWVILICKLRLNCRDLRCVTVMLSASYQVSCMELRSVHSYLKW